ncbi:MFS transporter [Prosthecobacter sp.]|uniref:MFS transporter n=1 Tax=Prosthecobacter sp. TaxID=1965333 RepID=UPI0037842768
MSVSPTPALRPRLPATVWALGWVSFFTDVSTEIVYPLLPVFLTTTLGASMAFVGLVEGIAESTASLLKIASGWWSDRVKKRKPLMIAGYGLSALTRPLIALAATGTQVLGARFMDRIGKGIRTSPRDALLAASVPPDQRGAAFGVQRTMDNAGAVLGPLIAWIMLQWFTNDYRVLFWLAVLPMVGAMACLVFGTRDQTLPPAAPKTQMPFSITPAFKNYLGAVLLFTLGNSSDAFLLLRAQAVGVPVSSLPLLWLALSLVKTLSSYPAGVLSDRIGRRVLILGGWCVYALVYAGFGLAAQPWHIWALFLAYGLFYGMTESTERALVADYYPDAQRGRAFGSFNFITGIGALPASLLMGWLWTAHGPRVAFTAGGALALCAVAWFAVKVPPAGEIKGGV